MRELTHPLRRWAETFEEDVRSGRMKLLEVVEIAVSEMVHYNEFCPACASETVRQGTVGYRHGECVACHFKRLRDGHNTRLAEIAARRQNDIAKQRVSRTVRRLAEASEQYDGDELDAMIDRILDEMLDDVDDES